MYEKFLKRVLDFSLGLLALVILSPVLLLLIILGVFFMRGNPFFVQERPGLNEKIFKLIKFRTMDNRTDKNGELLPDEIRLNKYGRFLRSTSLDELPELINIVKGDMAVVGPRPLLVRYLPYYTKEERHRHDVRPGLTGLAQISGRNNLEWDERLELDIEYASRITLLGDLKIILKTIERVANRKDVASGGQLQLRDLDDERRSNN